jgi:hypothetical protein
MNTIEKSERNSGLVDMNKMNCVRFRESEKTVIDIISSARNEDDLYETWLTPKDFRAIRFESQVIVNESRRSGMVSLLEHAITYMEDNPLEAEENLNLWAMHAHSRRGLECQISSSMKHYRKSLQRQVRASVMSLQDKLRLMNWSLEEKTKMIADVCIRETKVSKKIALALGKADMKAIILKANSAFKMTARSERNQYTVHEYSPMSTFDFDLS